MPNEFKTHFVPFFLLLKASLTDASRDRSRSATDSRVNVTAYIEECCSTKQN